MRHDDKAPKHMQIDSAPHAWLRERDIDILLCSEIHHDGELRRMLSRVSCSGAGAFEGAWVSQTNGDGESRGESDLVLIWSDDGMRNILLIENKIAAQYQPDQAARYLKRVLALRERSDVKHAGSLLLAPASYLARRGGEAFDHRMSYEEVADLLDASSDARSRFLASTLRRAIVQGKGNLPPHQATIRFWSECREVACEVAPMLNMRDNGEVSRNEGWHYFRQAEGIPTKATGIEIVYKPSNGSHKEQLHGTADLNVPRTSADALRARLSGFLAPDMTVVQVKANPSQKKAGRTSSAMVRIEVPSLRADAPGEPNPEALRAGVEACERLRRMAVASMDLIVGTMEPKQVGSRGRA